MFLEAIPSQAGSAQGRAAGRSAERLTHSNGDCDRRRGTRVRTIQLRFPSLRGAATSLSR